MHESASNETNSYKVIDHRNEGYRVIYTWPFHFIGMESMTGREQDSGHAYSLFLLVVPASLVHPH